MLFYPTYSQKKTTNRSIQMSETANPSASELADRQIIFTRVFNAPRELVFKAWTEPQHLMKWWGPKEWPLVVCNIDLRPGGVWHYCMKNAAGDEAWGKGIYREISVPERLVYADVFSDAEGNTLEGMPQGVMTVEFAERDGKTTTTITALYNSKEERDTILQMGMTEGMTESLNQLDNHLLTMTTA
jgi:uncharacterized protein YndB with AHSA1/START domain